MPTHTTVGSSAASLTTLIAQVEAAGETIIQALPAGDSWVVLTAPAPAPKPKPAQTRGGAR
jgi:hypothetical protein